MNRADWLRLASDCKSAADHCLGSDLKTDRMLWRIFDLAREAALSPRNFPPFVVGADELSRVVTPGEKIGTHGGARFYVDVTDHVTCPPGDSPRLSPALCEWLSLSPGDTQPVSQTP